MLSSYDAKKIQRTGCRTLIVDYLRMREFGILANGEFVFRAKSEVLNHTAKVIFFNFCSTQEVAFDSVHKRVCNLLFDVSGVGNENSGFSKIILGLHLPIFVKNDDGTCMPVTWFRLIFCCM